MFESIRLSPEELQLFAEISQKLQNLQNEYEAERQKIFRARDYSRPVEETRAAEKVRLDGLEQVFREETAPLEEQLKPLAIRKELYPVLGQLFQKFCGVPSEDAPLVFDVVVKPLLKEAEPVLLGLVQQFAGYYEMFVGDPAVCGSMARATRNQFEAFVAAGFTADQALTLTSAWVSKSIRVSRPG